MQSSRLATAQKFNTNVGTSGADIDVFFQSLCSNADEAVHNALVRADMLPDSSAHRPCAIAGNQRGVSYRPIQVAAYDSFEVSIPRRPTPAPRMVTLTPVQEWEGYVVDIGADTFVARLVDLTAGLSHETEEAIIPLEEVSERDVVSMAIGSVFRWVIGYERSVEGTRKRVSQIVFRELPRVTEADLREGRKWAQEIVGSFS